jgi:hypothetical protein
MDLDYAIFVEEHRPIGGVDYPVNFQDFESMMAYFIIKEIAARRQRFDVTVEEGI